MVLCPTNPSSFRTKPSNKYTKNSVNLVNKYTNNQVGLCPWEIALCPYWTLLISRALRNALIYPLALGGLFVLLYTLYTFVHPFCQTLLKYLIFTQEKAYPMTNLYTVEDFMIINLNPLFVSSWLKAQTSKGDLWTMIPLEL